MTLDLFVKLKYESSCIILFIGIRYSMRDLLFDPNNYAWPANWRYASNGKGCQRSLWHQLAL